MGKKGKKPAATKAETILDVGRVLTLLEVEPTTEDPALLDAIRYVRSHNPQVVTHSHARTLALLLRRRGWRELAACIWLACVLVR
jgi:hypothetical protein